MSPMDAATSAQTAPSLGRRLLLFLPLLGFVALLVWFGIGLTKDPKKLPSALIDRPAPEFALPPLHDNGKGLSSADLRGQVQIVNVFASWCGPCRIEHPLLMRMAGELGLTLHGISYKDRPADSQRFLAQLGDPYERIGLDLDGRVAIDWGVYGVPETFVVDKDGHIRYRYPGPLTPQELEQVVLPLVRELSR